MSHVFLCVSKEFGIFKSINKHPTGPKIQRSWNVDFKGSYMIASKSYKLQSIQNNSLELSGYLFNNTCDGNEPKIYTIAYFCWKSHRRCFVLFAWFFSLEVQNVQVMPSSSNANTSVLIRTILFQLSKKTQTSILGKIIRSLGKYTKIRRRS